jgi:predicted esterase
LAEGGCFSAPLTLTPPVPLLVYLHGRHSPALVAEENERQARVARMGNARGYAVLALRGVQGECTQTELAEWWCWPSNPRNAEHGADFVSRFQPSLAAARARIGAGPTMLLGFSNGGYFASLIATRALHPFDAVAIAHAGPVPPTHAPAGAAALPPLLLLTADDDLSDGEMRQLDDELTRERWGHELVAREGGHALLDWDVDMALTFFTRVRRGEGLPLRPPLQPPHPRPLRDAAPEAASDDDAGPVSQVDPTVTRPEEEDAGLARADPPEADD